MFHRKRRVAQKPHMTEPKIPAMLADGRFVEIAASGTFKGSAEVDAAKIAGHIDGELVVRDRLCLTATGRISGKVRYARLEVAPGGQCCGDVSIAEPVARSNAA